MKAIIIISMIILNTCTHSLGEMKPTFYFTIKDATMPVVVRGNVSSHVLILFLHGGPGGSAIKKIGLTAFNQLEESYGVVYWDQRGTASSRGNNKRPLTLNQFVDDLDFLIDCLKIKYPYAQIFLMGHSWGGGLGTAYLLDPKRQSKLTGWIDVAGAHNNPKGDSLSMVSVKKHAVNMIAKSRNTNYWKRALKWYERNPDFTSDQLRHYVFVRKARGYTFRYPPHAHNPEYTFSDLFKTPGQCIRFYIHFQRTLSRFIISDINLDTSMVSIKLPTLIIWGEKDGVIPVEMACEAYESLGTAKNDKYIVTFENTAHTVFYEQPERFTLAVKNFINKYYSCNTLAEVTR